MAPKATYIRSETGQRTRSKYSKDGEHTSSQNFKDNFVPGKVGGETRSASSFLSGRAVSHWRWISLLPLEMDQLTSKGKSCRRNRKMERCPSVSWPRFLSASHKQGKPLIFIKAT